MAILNREVGRLERKRSLTGREVALLVQVANATVKCVELTINPFGATGLAKLKKLPSDQLRAAIEALEEDPENMPPKKEIEK